MPTEPFTAIRIPGEVSTRIEVTCRNGRPCLRSSAGLLRAQRLHGPPDVCRVALVATTALLLGGDEVDLEVYVGPGARLELSDVAGTVAYHGRGRSAGWSTRIELDGGAGLVYRGQPFVIADGAEARRSLSLDAAPGAAALIRETLILGRVGEVGGAVHDRLLVRRAGAELLVEEQCLEPTSRHRPGLLGPHRVIDTLLALGCDPGPMPPGATRFQLLESGSTLTRYLGRSLSCSPLTAAL